MFVFDVSLPQFRQKTVTLGLTLTLAESCDTGRDPFQLYNVIAHANDHSVISYNMKFVLVADGWAVAFGKAIIIIIIIKNECHSNIIVDRLQGCSHSKKLRESESESRSSKVV